MKASKSPKVLNPCALNAKACLNPSLTFRIFFNTRFAPEGLREPEPLTTTSCNSVLALGFLNTKPYFNTLSFRPLGPGYIKLDMVIPKP